MALLDGRSEVRRGALFTNRTQPHDSIVPQHLAAHCGPFRMEDEKPDHGQDDDAGGDGIKEDEESRRQARDGAN